MGCLEKSGIDLMASEQRQEGDFSSHVFLPNFEMP